MINGKTHHQFQKGVAIIFTLLLVSIILSIVLALSAIFIPKLHGASEVKNSVTATYAAESVLEWCLYKTRIGDIDPPDLGILGLTYTVDPPDCSGTSVKATGTYGGVTRAFQLTY